MKEIKYRTPKELKQEVKKNKNRINTFFKQLKNKKPKDLDQQFHRLHDQAFAQFDCLNCANCCSGISPIVLQNDIDAIAKHLNIKASKLLQDYLYMDEDGDFVFKQTPCPFLGQDNYCSIYGSRPKACREYPHTNHRKMSSILDITEKNCEYCPIVNDIVSVLIENNYPNN